MERFKKLGIELPYYPVIFLLSIYPMDTTLFRKDIFTLKFDVALLTIAKICKQLQTIFNTIWTRDRVQIIEYTIVGTYSVEFDSTIWGIMSIAVEEDHKNIKASFKNLSKLWQLYGSVEPYM